MSVTLLAMLGQNASALQLPSDEESAEVLVSRLDYDFSGTVALDNCSGSIFRFDDSDNDDAALILTNGHGVEIMAADTVKRKKYKILPLNNLA